MRELEIQMSANALVKSLQKPASEFTKYDIIKYINDHGIKMLNFRYVGGDGKLKTLNFVITGKDYLESIFSTGERVDGSSLFTYVKAASSDLYVIPRFSTAFLNPFTQQPTLEILCSFYSKDGKPLESSPEYILRKANNYFTEKTGLNFKAMGELEYYIFSEQDDLFPAGEQKGYHASEPFTNYESIRTEAMRLIAECGGKIKYGHSEVGSFSIGNMRYEQHEIEFMPVDPIEAVEQLIIAKWILRMLCRKYGVTVSFAPKITAGQAGSGMHIHFMAERDGKNIMAKEDGLTDEARKIIAGMLSKAQSLTAFGNTLPTSYLRLVPNQEAPVKVCWGDSNRSVLVRVPLGWLAKTNMIKNANPQEYSEIPYIEGKQTAELRVPDGSADLYHLLAGMILSAEEGLNSDKSLEMAEKLYVNVDIFAPENKKLHDSLDSLPDSCAKSAEYLERDRDFYEKAGVFPQGTIDNIIQRLLDFKDDNLREQIEDDPEIIKKLVDKHIHSM
jgi:glutamine synthetase